MKTRSKSLGKKVAVGVVAFAMAGTLASAGLTSGMASANTDAKGKWYTDFASFEEEQQYAAELNAKIEAEGIVLLKNKNGTLPFSKSVKNVTLFGSRSYSPVYGGSGSGAGSGDYVPLTEGLERAGFQLNGRVKDVYERNTKTAVISGVIGGTARTPVEIDVENLANARGSYSFYHDALITTLTRDGGEGSDLWTKDIETHTDKTDHVLMLDDNEKDLINEMKAVKKQYGCPIVILINTANPLEIACLQDDDDIDAIVWVGQPGTNGFVSVGEVLNGTVNPSGKLVDVWGANFKHDPVWYNLVEYADTNNSYDMQEHEESIYMGYKWYETAYADGVLDKVPYYKADEATIPADKEGDVYYNRSSGVVYPFGYGLSYSTFSQKFVTSAADIKKAIDAAKGLDSWVQLQVEVENTGDVAGKDVVQLYVHSPYTDGGIEKAEIQLVSFAKTKTLAPGEKQVVTLDVRLGDIASFDYNDANKNGWKGWEIEAGNYDFRIQENSHDLIEKLTVALEAHKTDLDNDSNATNNTPLTNDDQYNTLAALDKSLYPEIPNSGHGSMVLMTRATVEGKSGLVARFPTTPGHDHDDYIINQITTSKYVNKPYTEFNDEATDPWYKTVSDIPANWTQATSHEQGYTDVTIKLKDMAGLELDDTVTILTEKDTNIAAFVGKTPAQAWDIFMNQLTYEEMTKFLSNGYFQTQALESVGKEYGEDADGPAQLGNGTFWACEVIIASTWNTELAYEQGVCVGNESLFMDVPGWYGPAFNIHRSPFFGRNYEYYSSDALQGGFIGAAVVAGAQSKGTNCYIKHYGLLGAGTNVYCEFATEQDIRENYFKCFEYAFKFGGATGCMTAGNRLGCRNTSSSWIVDTYIPCNEWGFKGTMITDWYWTGCGYSGIMLRCGDFLPLGNSFTGNNAVTGYWDATKRDGKGIVMENMKYDAESGKLVKVADDEVIQAPNQYYYVRTAVAKVLWVSANTSYNENCLDKSEFANQTVEVKVAIGANVSFAVDTEKLGTSDIVYKLTAGTLPEGLNFNANDGKITGTAKQVGSYEITVTMIADGWSKSTAKITINVAPFLATTESIDAVEAGQAFSTKFSQDVYEVGGKYNGYNIQSIAYSLRTEVPGLTMADDGTLSGTPTTPGTYEITVRTAVTYIGNRNRVQTANIDTTYTLVVTGAGEQPADEILFRVEEGALQYSVDNGANWLNVTTTGGGVGTDGRGIVSIEKTSTEGLVDTYTITYTDDTTSTFTITNGQNGTNGTNGADGKDGSGCNNSINAISAFAALGVVAVGVAGIYVLKNRKKNKD